MRWTKTKPSGELTDIARRRLTEGVCLGSVFGFILYQRISCHVPTKGLLFVALDLCPDTHYLPNRYLRQGYMNVGIAQAKPLIGLECRWGRPKILQMVRKPPIWA